MTIQNTQFLKNIKEEYSVPNGMPLSVFNNKYSRVKFFEKNPEFDQNQPVSPVNQEQLPVYQNWSERITDVVDGNFSLYYNHKDSYEKEKDPEYHETLKLSKQGVMAYAGRHLQHGDKDRNDRAKQHHCRNHQAEDSNAFAHLSNPPNQRPTDA